MVRTNVYTLLTVFVRLVALVFVLQALLQGVNLIVLSLTQGAADIGFFAIGIAGVLLLFGLVWLFADVLVKLALARPQGTAFESSLDADAWRDIGIGTIGIWFAASGLLDLLHVLLRRFYVSRQEQYANAELSGTFFADMGTSALQVLLGVGLLLGARGLVGLVRRMRGHDPVQLPSEPS